MDFASHRQALMAALPDNALVYVPGHAVRYRNADSEYPFRPCSHLYYLTGFDQSDVHLVGLKTGQTAKWWVFAPAFSQAKAVWVGNYDGPQTLAQRAGLTGGEPLSQLDAFMVSQLHAASGLYAPFSSDTAQMQRLNEWLTTYRRSHSRRCNVDLALCDLTGYLSKLRLIKTNDEVARIQKALDISIEGHLAAFEALKTADFEYEVEAAYLAACMRQGARFQAYPPIVASGSNACVLHYHHNNSRIAEHDLLLLDAGAEYHWYAADITRTYPKQPTFLAPQQAIYELVLAAQQAAIDLMKPGVRLNEIQATVTQVLIDGLNEIKAIDERVSEENIQFYYPHGFGHWIGLDVHDVGPYTDETGESTALAPGMVLTIEPGLYLSNHLPKVKDAYQGIGVRIEDVVHITKSGCEVLSKNLPKAVGDLLS